jgi:hypothetical protein
MSRVFRKEGDDQQNPGYSEAELTSSDYFEQERPRLCKCKGMATPSSRNGCHACRQPWAQCERLLLHWCRRSDLFHAQQFLNVAHASTDPKDIRQIELMGLRA